MQQFRYTYQNKKKYICPNCGQKTLKRFIDTTTNQLIDEHYGVCERIFSCGYEKRPDKEIIEHTPIERPPTIPFYFKPEILQETQGKLNNNVLFSFFCKTFGEAKSRQVFEKYKIGTSNFGNTIFWQIDEHGKIRAGKQIQYFTDGHRNKARGANWLHWSSGFEEGRHSLNQVLFGQHLISGIYNSIFIVESEKTALICEICKREKDVLFLACGGLQNIGLVAKLKIEPHQKIWLIPDNDANQMWQQKIDKLNLCAEIKIITALQEMKRGADVGDLLLNKINHFPNQEIK